MNSPRGGPGRGTMSTMSSKGALEMSGFQSFFLTETEKWHFSQYKTLPEDESISSKILDPLWRRIVDKLHPSIAPNVLNFIGMLLVIQSWHMSRVYSVLYPSVTTLAVVCQLTAFYVLHSIAPVHGKKQRQHTPVTELFGYTTDCISSIFLILTVWTLLDVDFAPSVETQWHAVMGAQLVMFSKHLSAQKREAGIRYSLLGGPGEVMTLILFVLLLRATVGVDYGPRYMLNLWTTFLAQVSLFVADYLPLIPSAFALPEMVDLAALYGNHEEYRDPVKVGALSTRLFFYAASIVVIGQIVRLGRGSKNMKRREHYNWTRFSLALCVMLRFIPAALFFRQRFDTDSLVDCQKTAAVESTWGTSWLSSWLGTSPEAVVAASLKCSQGASAVTMSSAAAVDLVDVILDGMFLSMLTTEVVLSKMAKRGLHPWMVVMTLASASSHFMGGACCAFYFSTVFVDVCHFMNIGLMSVCRNVYCDGVYDLCHIGHKNAFRNALAHGNRLFVGVVGDKDASGYKRPPVMSHAERCAEVEACKSVTKVIPNAPCFGISKEFLEEHQIHVVCMGQEYIDRWPDPKDDKYYRIPRQMGITRILPRTQCLSTSKLIARIQKARLEKTSET